jgi:hypothetical protein
MTCDLLSLGRVLRHIDDRSARKIVIMSKRERNEITDAECELLIQLFGLADA